MEIIGQEGSEDRNGGKAEEKKEAGIGSGEGSEGRAKGDGKARYRVYYDGGSADAEYCIVSVGRSGSKWMEKVCRELEIPTKSNRVDIGVRVELPAVVFSHLTDELYESKIVYPSA